MIIYTNKTDDKTAIKLSTLLTSEVTVANSFKDLTFTDNSVIFLNLNFCADNDIINPEQVSLYIANLIRTLNCINACIDDKWCYAFIINMENKNTINDCCAKLIYEFLMKLAEKSCITMINTKISAVLYPNFAKMRLGFNDEFTKEDAAKFDKIVAILKENEKHKTPGFLNVINLD